MGPLQIHHVLQQIHHVQDLRVVTDHRSPTSQTPPLDGQRVDLLYCCLNVSLQPLVKVWRIVILPFARAEPCFIGVNGFLIS